MENKGLSHFSSNENKGLQSIAEIRCSVIKPPITDSMASGVARPRPTRACALPSTSQALPSPTQLESHDSTTNQTKDTYLSCCANRY